MKFERTSLSTIGLLFLTLTFAAPACSAASKIVRIGHIPLTASLPIYVAAENQCFEKERLTVELVSYGSSNDVADAGIARQIDVVGAAATNAMLDAATKARKTVRAFLFTQYVKRAKQQSTDFLVAQPEIRMLSELKGRKIAFFPGSVSRVLAQLTLPKYGLTIDDITVVEMPPAKWEAALAHREIDAAHILEPVASRILANGAYNVLIDGYWGEVQERVPVAAAWFVNGSLSADEEAKFYRALECGLKEIEAQPDLARKALVKYTGVAQSLAPQIRLLEYAMSSDLSAAEQARSFIELLQTNKATIYSGTADAVIYRQQ